MPRRNKTLIPNLCSLLICERVSVSHAPQSMPPCKNCCCVAKHNRRRVPCPPLPILAAAPFFLPVSARTPAQLLSSTLSLADAANAGHREARRSCRRCRSATFAARRVPPATHLPRTGHLLAICALIRARGLEITAERSVCIDKPLAAALYDQHKDRDFYPRCVPSRP